MSSVSAVSVVAGVLAGLSAPASLGDQTVGEEKLVASDGAAGDLFGYSVAVFGDLVVVGAFHDADNGPDSGSAYVFRFNGLTWAQEEKLLPNDGAEGDAFGRSVAVSDDTAVVGAFHNDDGGPDRGSAYFFRFNGSTWDEQKVLSSDIANRDHFGSAVAISGDVAVIGCFLDDDVCPSEPHCNSGSAYIFRFNGSTWVEEQKLVAADGEEEDHFGQSVAISGDVVVIGALLDDDACPADPECDSGSAYVFRFNGSSWVQEQKLVASDGAAGDLFSDVAVSVSGDTALVGASRHAGNAIDTSSSALSNGIRITRLLYAPT